MRSNQSRLRRKKKERRLHQEGLTIRKQLTSLGTGGQPDAIKEPAAFRSSPSKIAKGRARRRDLLFRREAGAGWSLGPIMLSIIDGVPIWVRALPIRWTDEASTG